MFFLIIEIQLSISWFNNTLNGLAKDGSMVNRRRWEKLLKNVMLPKTCALIIVVLLFFNIMFASTLCAPPRPVPGAPCCFILRYGWQPILLYTEQFWQSILALYSEFYLLFYMDVGVIYGRRYLNCLLFLLLSAPSPLLGCWVGSLIVCHPSKCESSVNVIIDKSLEGLRSWCRAQVSVSGSVLEPRPVQKQLGSDYELNVRHELNPQNLFWLFELQFFSILLTEK